MRFFQLQTEIDSMRSASLEKLANAAGIVDTGDQRSFGYRQMIIRVLISEDPGVIGAIRW
jgi:hypothetical protein